MIDPSRPVLSLAELDGHDPGGDGKQPERRYLCPLPNLSCPEHQNPRKDRSLAVNLSSGDWHCHRCGQGGRLREHWREKPAGEWKAQDRRERTRADLNRRFGLSKQPPGPALPDAAPERSDADSRFKEQIRLLVPLAGSLGAAYLERRGIALDLAREAKAMFSPDWFGVPAVVFPLRGRPDATGKARLLGAQGRAVVDTGTNPNKRTKNAYTDAGMGVFAASPEAWSAGTVALVEAPIDGLSLAAAGLPALALGGKEIGAARSRWFLPHFFGRRVLVAFDSDAAGEEASERAGELLRGAGAVVRRLRPPDGAKDWNESLCRDGADALRVYLRNAGVILEAATAPAAVPEPATRRPTPPAESGYPATDEEEPGALPPFCRATEATDAPDITDALERDLLRDLRDSDRRFETAQNRFAGWLLGEIAAGEYDGEEWMLPSGETVTLTTWLPAAVSRLWELWETTQTGAAAPVEAAALHDEYDRLYGDVLACCWDCGFSDIWPELERRREAAAGGSADPKATKPTH